MIPVRLLTFCGLTVPAFLALKALPTTARVLSRTTWRLAKFALLLPLRLALCPARRRRGRRDPIYEVSLRLSRAVSDSASHDPLSRRAFSESILSRARLSAREF